MLLLSRTTSAVSSTLRHTPFNRQISSAVQKVIGSPIREVAKFGMYLQEQFPEARIDAHTMGNTTHKPPWQFQQKLAEVVFNEMGYTDFAGESRARQAIANYHQRKLVDQQRNTKAVTIGDVALCSGITDGLTKAMNALTNPNDPVVIFPPFFASYTLQAQGLYREPVVVQKEGSESMHEAFDRTLGQLRERSPSQNIATIICSPNNPDDEFIPKEQMKGLMKVAEKHRSHVIFDGAYQGMVYRYDEQGCASYDNERDYDIAAAIPREILSRKEAKPAQPENDKPADPCVWAVYGVTKGPGAPGARAGHMICYGGDITREDGSLQKPANAIGDMAFKTTGAASSPVSQAYGALFTNDIQKQISNTAAEHYGPRLQALAGPLKDAGLIDKIPDAAMYVTVPVEAMMGKQIPASVIDFSKLQTARLNTVENCEQAVFTIASGTGVLGVPGEAFGDKSMMRLVASADPEKLAISGTLLAEYLTRAKEGKELPDTPPYANKVQDADMTRAYFDNVAWKQRLTSRSEPPLRGM